MLLTATVGLTDKYIRIQYKKTDVPPRTIIRTHDPPKPIANHELK